MAKHKSRVEFSNNVAVAEIEIINEETENMNTCTLKNKSLNKKKLVFRAMFLFKLLGLLTYISDVGSDIGNGYEYLRTQTEWPKLSNNSGYNYTRELCDDWQSYRHVKMGILTMSIVFIPSAICVLVLGMLLVVIKT